MYGVSMSVVIPVLSCPVFFPSLFCISLMCWFEPALITLPLPVMFLIVALSRCPIFILFYINIIYIYMKLKLFSKKLRDTHAHMGFWFSTAAGTGASLRLIALFQWWRITDSCLKKTSSQSFSPCHTSHAYLTMLALTLLVFLIDNQRAWDSPNLAAISACSFPLELIGSFPITAQV